jgi:hypothetical protein
MTPFLTRRRHTAFHRFRQRSACAGAIDRTPVLEQSRSYLRTLCPLGLNVPSLIKAPMIVTSASSSEEVRPGRPRDCSLGLPQIRTCASKTHPARHVVDSLSLSRSICLDTLVRFDALGVVLTSGPQRGTPFAPRGPGGPVPPLRHSYGALRLLVVHRAALRFLRLAIPSFRPLFVPTSSGRELWINLELVSRDSSRQSRWRRQGLPSSRGTFVIIRHILRPRRDQARGWVQVSLMPGAAPASDNNEGSPRGLISGLNRIAFDLAVYASQ